MKNNETETTTAEKPGFFKRMVSKLDTAMKEKADAKAEEGCCCGPESNANDDSEGCCGSDRQDKKDSECC